MEVLFAAGSITVIFSIALFIQRRQFVRQLGQYTSLIELQNSVSDTSAKFAKLNEQIHQSNLNIEALQKQEIEQTNALNEQVKQATSIIEALHKQEAEQKNTQEKVSLEINFLEEKKKFLESEIPPLITKRDEALNNYQAVQAQYKAESESFEKISAQLENAKTVFAELNERTKEMQALESRVGRLSEDESRLTQSIRHLKTQLDESKSNFNLEMSRLKEEKLQKEVELSELLSRIDLYSRIDEFTCVGHYEQPNYLYETSLRYASEIKEIRELQRELIRQRKAVTYPDDLLLCEDRSLNKKILDGQANLLLTSFNIECDYLIERVSPSSFARTLEQIEAKAEQLEKNLASLKCGFSIEYVELKYKECQLHFEYKLKKQEEQEEQRLIREQMKEEARLQKQYDDAIKEAEREELLFRRLIDKAKDELNKSSGNEYALTLAKISELEARLREAEEKGQRAKSMAEQTRRGFVYIVSNIGSFGDGVYKIGLTRRLDPQERIDELSGASVPFSFDIHAMCFSEDAPALENSLHKYFSRRRINAVNLRKEFFRVSLDEIKAAIKEIVGTDVDFKEAVRASDYYETRRLLGA